MDKSRDSELQNYISLTAVEEQWNSNSALKVHKLVTPLLRKWPLNILLHLLEATAKISRVKVVKIVVKIHFI